MPDQKPDPLLETPALTPAAGTLRVGPRATLGAALVLSLSKAARAFTLYDASNALIRQFLAEYRARTEAATAGGPVVLDVSPYELACEGEVIYRDDDREKSLAFKLYRDGVRRVTFLPEPSFQELLRFLEILAIRMTGIRQAEDDVVTLLRKARFTSIDVVAVEEYTADEIDPTRPLGHGTAAAPRIDPAFDTPLPRLPAPGPIAFREVPAAAVIRLRREEDPATVVGSALSVTEELLGLGSRGAMPAEDVARFCADLRDYLVADGQVAPLAALADLVRRLAGDRIRDELMRALGDARLLDLVLSAIPAGASELPPHAARLLPFVPSSAVIDRLAGAAEGRRPGLVALVAARLPADADVVVARLASVPAPVARALAKALGAKAPNRVGDAAVALLDHPDQTLQAEALRAVGALPGKVPAHRLVKLLEDRSERIRTAAAVALERHGDATAARVLADALESRRNLSRDEAAAYARALGTLKPAVAQKLYAAWLHPKRGLLRALRTSEREEVLRWAAVAGLGAIGGAEAQNLVEGASASGDEEFRRHCHAALARLRREGGHG